MREICDSLGGPSYQLRTGPEFAMSTAFHLQSLLTWCASSCCDPLIQAPAAAPEHVPEIEIISANNQRVKVTFLYRQATTPAADSASCLDSQSEQEVALLISFWT